MKKILITGSSGFVGKALKQRLLSDGFKVFEMNSNCDITMPDSFYYFKDEQIDYVFHLAAKTFVPDSWEKPQSFYQTNTLGTVNVLEFCRNQSISLTFMSAYVYGQPERLPISENDMILPNNPYAHSKYLAEQICEFYAKEFGVDTIIIRPFNVYGIGQSDKFIIPGIIKQALECNEIRVKDLTPKRDYIYIDDLIDALILSMKFSKHFAVYNIGSGYSLSVEDVICVVQKVLRVNKKVVLDSKIRKNEINNVVAEISKAKEEFGWYPKVTFYQGIKRIIENMTNDCVSRQQIPINKGNYSMETPEREELFERYKSEGWEEGYLKYREGWVVYAEKKIISEYPLLVDTELASRCNLKCPMCYTVTDEFKGKVNVRLMDFELFKKIIDEIGGKVPALRLSLRGEPTLHPKFIECIHYAKQTGIKEVSFLTNGSKLTRKFFEIIMKAGADWITISIDGINEVYENIRKPLKFNETLQKIIDIKKIKNEYKSRKPVIKIQSVWPAIRDNPEAYYNMFKPYADLVAFNSLIDYLGKDKDIVYEDNFSCPQHYQRLVIGADGLAMMCSNDEENLVVVGNAKKESVYEIWHGEKLNEIRNLHKKRKGFMEIEVCRKCYLPRKTEDYERAFVNGREFIIKNYVNRRQEIGR